MQAAGLQGMLISELLFLFIQSCIAAVRKNRYVILPVDFEEAWKVRWMLLIGTLKILINPTFPANGQTLGRHTRVL